MIAVLLGLSCPDTGALGAGLSRQVSVAQLESMKEQSRFARFEGANPARRGSMFGASDHESWGFEPSGPASFQRRESRNYFADAARSSIDEPQRLPSFLAANDSGPVSSAACARLLAVQPGHAAAAAAPLATPSASCSKPSRYKLVRCACLQGTPRAGAAGSSGLGRWGSWGAKAFGNSREQESFPEMFLHSRQRVRCSSVHLPHAAASAGAGLLPSVQTLLVLRSFWSREQKPVKPAV